MPCTGCNGPSMIDQFYHRVDEQNRLELGAWRWASRCQTCGTMVYEPVESLSVNVPERIDRTNMVSMS